MIPGSRLAGERLSRFRALGVQGEPAWRYAGQLRAALIGRLGQEHADLLAVPQVDESGERIDWYAPFEGSPVVQVDRLSPPERTELDVRARRLQEDIENLAQQLGQSGRTDNERNFSRLLRHALTVPGRTMLFSVAGRPVFAFWGFAADPSQNTAITAAPIAATAAAAPAAAAMASEAPVARAAVLSSTGAGIAVDHGRDGWKLAALALFLLLLLALGAWLIKPYLPVLLGLEEFGRRAAAAVPATELPEGVAPRQAALARMRDDGARLEQQFRSLGNDLSGKQSSCAPGSIGAVVGPSGEIVAADGGIVGQVVVEPDGKVALMGPDGKTIVGTDGKPVDARVVAEQAARERARGGKAVGRTGDGTRREAANLPPGERQALKPGEKLPGDKQEQAKLPDGKQDLGKLPGDKQELAKLPGDKQEQGKLPGDKQGQGKMPAEKQEQAKIEKPLTVPADARAKRDVTFMQGDWRSRSTLTTQRGTEDIRINYEFDDKGKGKSMIVQQNGVTCEAPAVARFDKDGKLVIEEQANPKCSDGTSYVKSVVTCDVGKEGSADCGGRNEGGKTYSVQIGK